MSFQSIREDISKSVSPSKSEPVTNTVEIGGAMFTAERAGEYVKITCPSSFKFGWLLTEDQTLDMMATLGAALQDLLKRK